ncbi:MAG: ATP-binding protein [Myxococcota bacterium]
MDHSVYHRMFRVLERHMSEITARMILERATERCELSVFDLSEQHIPELLEAMRVSLNIFVSDDNVRETIRRELRALSSSPPGTPELASAPPTNGFAARVPIKTETDITTARRSARQICIDLDLKSFVTQKIVTIVSELARNIVNYTPGGTVEVSTNDSKNRVRIVSTDRGVGISNLEEIMSGEYRSRTGLGRGLMGTKRMADHFDIETGRQGTKIEVEVAL